MRKQMTTVFGSVVLLTTATLSAALPEPTMTIPLMRKAPVVDGTVKPDEWCDANGFMGYCRYPTETLSSADAMTYVGRTRDRLYIGAVCEVGPYGLKNMGKPRRGNVSVVYEDTFEFVFVPDRTATKPTLRTIMSNFNGAYQTVSQVAGAMESWIPETMEIKSQMVDGKWHMEWSVKLAEIGFTPNLHERHALRICRNWRNNEGGGWGFQSSLRPNESGFFAMAKAIPCDFVDGPAVGLLGAVRQGGGATWATTVRLSNPTDKELKLKVFGEGRPVNSQPGALVRELSLASGQIEDLPLTGPILGDEAVRLKLRVEDAATGVTNYFREVVWRPNAEPIAWWKPGDVGAAVKFDFAYYPSYDKMRLRADLSGMLEKRPPSVGVEIRNAKKAVLWTKDLALDATGVFDDVVAVPDLKAATRETGDGSYAITMTVQGLKDGVFEKKFRRDVFEWEGNTLGLSNAIPEPFVPVKKSMCEIGGEKMEKVSVVLRDHLVDRRTGLWRQVTAAGKDVLARPMAFVSTSTSQPLSFSTSQLSATADWDVDGMMLWTLTLQPGHYEPMAVEIPIKAERAKLTHACADGIRYNGGGEVPPGTGRVWDSSKAPRTSIVGDYVPYVWVGGPLRGIAVFGENDKGWVVGDGKVPCQEIIREKDGTVVLRLNLLQKSVDIDEARTIKIGFQATPVKSMEKDWRSSPIGNLIGSCYYWGGVVASDAVAPFDGTDEYFRKMGEARRTGKTDAEYIERSLKTVADWKKELPDYKEYYGCMKAHFYSGHNTAASTRHNAKLVFYTNGRGVELGIPSGKTFCDQWTVMQFLDRDKIAGRFVSASYELDPDRSYLDYAAWWWKKMLESEACDYLYWDDVFCQSSFNLVGSDAYRMADGVIQPSSGIFNQRAQVRRCAVLQAEMGRPCRKNWVHMTNTALAPVLAFAGTNYDWEDVAGDSALQERYSKAYIQALSLGRQFGNRVAVMGYFSTDDAQKLKWLHRTGTGAVITHELQWHRVPEWNKANATLEEWGYRLPTTQVWNYWDEDVVFPVAVTGGEYAALAMRRADGEAVIVVSDWKKGGDYIIRPDCAALGIKAGFRAYDLETGKNLLVVDNAVEVPLAKLDYVMIGLR